MLILLISTIIITLDMCCIGANGLRQSLFQEKYFSEMHAKNTDDDSYQIHGSIFRGSNMNENFQLSHDRFSGNVQFVGIVFKSIYCLIESRIF